jgi:hypothetical protein
MRDRTFTIRLSGLGLNIALGVLLVGAVLVPVTALAAGQFADDDGNTHETNIEWLASKGITVGCNPPANDNYCPGDPVTRGQMATFMQRLVDFLGDPGTGMVDGAVHASTADSASTASTATDADQVGGFAANELVRVAGCAADNAPDGINYQCSFPLNVPVDGWAALTGSVDLSAGSSTPHGVSCFFQVDGRGN